VPDEGEINMEDLIANEGSIITITHAGFIKRTLASEYRSQRRGGKGVIGMTTREGAAEGDAGDFVEHLFTASTHDYLMFFTKTGRCYVKRVYELPEGSRTSRGRSIVNFLDLRPDEKIAATIRVQRKIVSTDEGPVDQTWDPTLHVLFATRTGIIKKTNLSDFDNVRRGGIIAITIEEGDELIEAELTNGSNSIVLVTHDGMSLRFHEDEARPMGRTAVGNWGIRPEEGDYLVAMVVVHPEATLLVAGTNGIGKRTPFDDYREQARGGKGIITMKTGALTVLETDELMLTTNKGKTVRTRVSEIREAGRNTMGVKLIELARNEKLQDIARVISQGDNEEAPAADADAPPDAAPEDEPPADGSVSNDEEI
jgi:DNA gyrase subunit A